MPNPYASLAFPYGGPPMPGMMPGMPQQIPYPMPSMALPPHLQPKAAGAAPKDSGTLKLLQEAKQGRDVVAVLKDKVENVGGAILIEGLFQIARKAGFKQRQELTGTATVKRMAERIKHVLKQQPTTPAAAAGGQGLGNTVLAKAVLALAKLELGEKNSFGFAAKSAQLTPVARWSARSMAHMVWGLARADVIDKQLVTQVVAELSTRVRELDADSMAEVLSGIAKARVYKEGVTETIRRETSDEKLFHSCAQHAIQKVDQFVPRQLAELVHCYVQIGQREDEMFKVFAPRILDKQKELTDVEMAKCIKAYSRFGIPLRQTKVKAKAIVCKGDFIRPSDKPSRKDMPNDIVIPVPLSKAILN